MSAEKDLILKVENISKTYPGVQALKNVSTTIEKGEVRALVGENGAGKSTFIKCVMGVEKPTSGTIYMMNDSGEWVIPQNAIETKELGMHANYQNVNIASELSIAENYFLGRIPKKKSGIVDWKKMYSESAEVIKKFQMDVKPGERISELPIAMQAMVTISKISVNDKIRLVIFDEPTALLENDKVEILFNYIKELKNNGVSVIYISHRLEEVEEICDTVSILKDGELVETCRVKDIDKDYMIAKMVGRKMTDIYNIKHQTPGEELLRVENFTGHKSFENASFSLHAGEILGFFGLVGAGRSEIMRAIFGIDKIAGGSIYIKGKEQKIKNPQDAMACGIGFLTEDRHVDGLALPLTIKTNVNMFSYKAISKAGVINLNKEAGRAKEYVDKINIRTPSINQTVINLSGGNQQKVVIAKLLCNAPDVLIFDEPTVGVDVGAKQEIYKIIEEIASQGKGIIIISSYLPEVMGLSDRLVVMSSGEIVKTLTTEELKNASEEDILRLASQHENKLETNREAAQ